MTEKKPRLIMRKLALPLEVKIGNDTVVSDGFFFLTSKETGKIRIVSVDADGYATCEILPPPKERPPRISAFISEGATLIGTEMSKTRGSGEDFGQYRYFKRPDGFYYAIVSSKSRPRRISMGKLIDRNSRISIFAQAILRKLNGMEFTKKDILTHARGEAGIPKHLTHGQILKALLDTLKLEGYLEKREEKERGRMREYFKVTEKMFSLLAWSSPEQAQNEYGYVAK